MTAKKYKIKAQLYDNPTNPNDFVARVTSDRSLNVYDICDAAVKRGEIKGVNTADMTAAVNAFLKETTYQLCDGNIVNTDLFTVVPKIKGSFNSENEKFIPTNHRLIFYFHQGAMLCEEAKKVYVDINGLADMPAAILQVTDVKTGSVNNTITPRHALKIAGNRVKICGENRQNGVYFVNETSGWKTKIDDTDIVSNTPAELVIMTPELARGSYKIELITQYSAAQYMLKEPKTAVFDKVLTVG